MDNTFLVMLDNNIFASLLANRSVLDRLMKEITNEKIEEYLSNKLKKLKDARIGNIILCIDATKNCTDSDLPAGARIIRYKRKINPAEVLSIAL